MASSGFEQEMVRRLEAEAAALRTRIVGLQAELVPLPPDCALGRQGRVETQAYQAVRAQELQALQTQLQGTEEALARLRAGTYGRCHRCGEAIAEQRLRAWPQARDCSACAA